MNSVVLIGRLARDPELSYTPNTQAAMCKFTIAVDRPRRRDGGDPGADFIRIIVWDRQAENCDRYLSKGRQVAVLGRIQTGSYKNREGVTVYTTDVVADRVEFLGNGQGGQNQGGSYSNQGGGYNQGGNGGYNNSGNGYNQGGNGGFGGSNYGNSGNSGFGGNDYGNSGNSGFGGQNTGFGGQDDGFGGQDGGQAQSTSFGGFDDLPDTFQAAEDDIPF